MCNTNISISNQSINEENQFQDQNQYADEF